MAEPRKNMGQIRSGVFEEQYYLIRPLIRASPCEVYIARKVDTDERVMVWLAPSSGSDRAWFALDFIARANAERRARHRSILRIVAQGVDRQGMPFLVEEYVSENTLADVLPKETLSTPQAIEVLTSVAEGVAFAHERGVIHGTLSPKSILVSTDVHPWVAKVRGFSFIGSSHTVSTTLSNITEPAYAAPEVLSGVGPITKATDVWSFGVLMYFLLAGKLPFSGTTTMDVMSSICSTQGLKNLEIPLLHPLPTLIAACLKREPTQRPSMHEVLSTLKRLERTTLYRTSGNSNKIVPPEMRLPIKDSSLKSSSRVNNVKSLEPVHFKNDKCEFFASYPKPNIYLAKVSGYFDTMAAHASIEAIERIVSPHANIFCDWFEMTGYDSDARIACTQWTIKNRHRVSVEVLVRSKLVAMGVTVAQLAIGNPILRAHTRREDFEHALQVITRKEEQSLPIVR